MSADRMISDYERAAEKAALELRTREWLERFVAALEAARAELSAAPVTVYKIKKSYQIAIKAVAGGRADVTLAAKIVARALDAKGIEHAPPTKTHCEQISHAIFSPWIATITYTPPK